MAQSGNVHEILNILSVTRTKMSFKTCFITEVFHSPLLQILQWRCSVYCNRHQLLCFQYYIPFVQSQFSASKNNNTGFHNYNVPETILSTFHLLIHLLLSVAYEVGTIHEETEAQRVCHLPNVTQLITSRASTKIRHSSSWGVALTVGY